MRRSVLVLVALLMSIVFWGNAKADLGEYNPSLKLTYDGKPIVLPAIEDAWVETASPDSNHNDSELRLFKYGDPENHSNILFKFDMSTIPEDAIITEASLVLYNTSEQNWNGAITRIRHFTDNWSEDTVTSNHRVTEMSSTSIIWDMGARTITPGWNQWDLEMNTWNYSIDLQDNILTIALYARYAVSTAGNAVFISKNDGLVAYYPFNGNANDESGNVNDGVVYGAILAEDRFGNSQSAYSFDRQNYIGLPSSETILGANPSSWSYSVWFKVNEYYREWQTIISDYYSSSGDTLYGIRLEVYNSKKLQVSLRGGETTYVFLSNKTISEGTWYHATVVISKNNGMLKLYINGEFDNQTTFNTSIDYIENVPMSIGRVYYLGRTYGGFDGVIDEVRIYSRALSEAEIQELAGELGDGVNLQPSYFCSGNMNLGWNLMKEYDKIKSVRIEMDPGGQANLSDFTRWIKEGNDNGYQVIATYHSYTDNGSPNPATLITAALWWEDNYSALSTAGPFTINLMNEWGDHDVDAPTYAAAYNAAIPAVRGAGYSGPIICDIPGWGQETHVAAAASPLIIDNNIIFSVHIYPSAYNNVTGDWMQMSDLDHLGNAGRPVLVGEFGSKADSDIGADWLALVDHAKSKGWTVMGWAWNGDNSTDPMNMISPYWGDICNATSYSKTSYFNTVYDKLGSKQSKAMQWIPLLLLDE